MKRSRRQRKLFKRLEDITLKDFYVPLTPSERVEVNLIRQRLKWGVFQRHTKVEISEIINFMNMAR